VRKEIAKPPIRTLSKRRIKKENGGEKKLKGKDVAAKLKDQRGVKMLNPRDHHRVKLIEGTKRQGGRHVFEGETV